MMLMQSLPNDLPTKMGDIALMILKLVTKHGAQEIHFVCDSYTKSIKGMEQNARGANEQEFSISGSDQKRPRDFKSALQSPKFKTAFLRLLMTEWKSDK